MLLIFNVQLRNKYDDDDDDDDEYQNSNGLSKRSKKMETSSDIVNQRLTEERRRRRMTRPLRLVCTDVVNGSDLTASVELSGHAAAELLADRCT